MFTNSSADGGEERGFVLFGNREPWRNRMSFSQEVGWLVVAWSIGLISTAKGHGIDREGGTLPYTSFLSDIWDRG